MSFIDNGRTWGHLIPTRRLLQGDPISVYLFVLCAEAFSGLISLAMERDRIYGVSVCRRTPSISNLFFADDNVLLTRDTT